MHAFYRDAAHRAAEGAVRAGHIPDHGDDAAGGQLRDLTRNNVDYVPLDELDGRVATTLFVVYPPGIATVVPGERLDARSQPMVITSRCSKRARTSSRASSPKSRAFIAKSTRPARSLLYLCRQGVIRRRDGATK